MTTETLIAKNNRDIALFREYIAKLYGKPTGRAYIGDLERRIAMAERSRSNPTRIWKMSILRKLWWGLYPLPTAFWGFYVFGGFVVFFLPIFLGALLIMYVPQLRPIIYITALCISWAYWATASVGVWRSANFYKGTVRWVLIAKTIVGLIAFSFFVRLINGGAHTLISRTMSNWN